MPSMKTKPEDVSDAVVPISLAALALAMFLLGMAVGNGLPTMSKWVGTAVLLSPLAVVITWGIVMHLCIRKATVAKAATAPLTDEDVGAAICKTIGEPITFEVTLLPAAREVVMRLAVERGLSTAADVYKQAMADYIGRHGR